MEFISVNFISIILFMFLSIFIIPFFSSFLCKIILYNFIFFFNFKKIFEKGIIYTLIYFLPNLLCLFISEERNFLNNWFDGSILYIGFIFELEKIKPNIIPYIIHNDIRDLIGFIFGPILFSNILINLISYNFFYILNNYDGNI